MNYAIWALNFTDNKHGTGPEAKIAKLGFTAEAGWSDGEVQDGALILGYLSEPQDESALTAWEFQNITQEEALAFCLEIDPEAFLLDNGKIIVPEKDYAF